MIVLDTHVWHWWINQIPGRLSPSLIYHIETADRIGVSAIARQAVTLPEHLKDPQV